MAGFDLLERCERAVALAARRGASQAEGWAERSRTESVRVRGGEVESITRSEGKGLGLRAIVDGRLGFAWTSDLSDAGLEDLARRAVALAKVSAPDDANRLPDAGALAPRNPDLHGIWDPEVADLSTAWKVEAARTMERAARETDRRIAGFDAVEASDSDEEVAIHSSEGAHDRYRSTRVRLSVAPVARGDGGEMQTSVWLDTRRPLRDLDPPEAIGRVAARRAVRMLGARRPQTRRVPVVFEPRVAAFLVADLAAAVDGDRVRKGASFLAGRLGERIAPETVSLVDDGLLPGGIATAPFDGEGLPTRRTAVIERGVLRSFLYDTAAARRSRTGSTTNARRGYDTLPTIGVFNFYMLEGSDPAASIVAGVKEGLYVTALLGRGANAVTGSYSRGANGLWIRGGELAEPVHEATVSGNLLEMLQGIDAVGDDLDRCGPIGAPTLRFRELTVSGD